MALNWCCRCAHACVSGEHQVQSQHAHIRAYTQMRTRMHEVAACSFTDGVVTRCHEFSGMVAGGLLDASAAKACVEISPEW